MWLIAAILLNAAIACAVHSLPRSQSWKMEPAYIPPAGAMVSGVDVASSGDWYCLSEISEGAVVIDVILARRTGGVVSRICAEQIDCVDALLGISGIRADEDSGWLLLSGMRGRTAVPVLIRFGSAGEVTWSSELLSVAQQPGGVASGTFLRTSAPGSGVKYVAAWSSPATAAPGVLAGADVPGKETWRCDGVLAQFGLVPVVDSNGDSTEDVVAVFLSEEGRREIRIVDGTTGEIIAAVACPRGLISDITTVGDLSGDGVSEIVLGMPTKDSGRGAVFVLRSDTGAILMKFFGSREGGGFGASVAVVRGREGGEAEDLLVGAIGSPFTWLANSTAWERDESSYGEVVLISLSTGEELNAALTGMKGDYFGRSTAVLTGPSGRCTGVVVTSPGYRHASGARGGAWLIRP